MDEFEEQLNLSDCLNLPDKKCPIKSVATVKHQMVRSPANFAKLKCNTDLNIPISMHKNLNAYGFQQDLSQSTGFPSFRMAHLFPDCLGEVDVVSCAENIKRLLKLPYAKKNSTISMMVHRIGNTLLIDDFDINSFLLEQETNQWNWLKSFICEHIVTRLDNNVEISRTDATSRRLLSTFLSHSLQLSDNKIDNALREIESNHQQQRDGPLLPEPSEENVPDPKHTKHTFNRNVIWTFEDIRMLIGTDMAIFGGTTRPCISLRLRDMCQPINVLTGIDYWLDNLMCNVPEVVMCYHLDGLVQKYEIIKTEDLPFLENSKFSANSIRNVAQNILSFLKQNATKAGHTYWLFKGQTDDVVKLYDLTSLCTDAKQAQSDSAGTSGKSDNNPFTVPVAMLLYKVARNMKNSSEKIGAKQAGSIKELLINCIKLLPAETHPQIVTSSYYLLADLHVPSGIDPISPDDYEENSNSDDLLSVENERLPPPLVESIDERCWTALKNIKLGLECLKYFSISEAKLSKEREEIERLAEKTRIVQEEQNPNMAKRYQAIPLPYEQIKLDTTKETERGQQLQCQSPLPSAEIQTWNEHLKLLLVEKICTVYSIFAEQAYQQCKYGCALKFLSIALKCYHTVAKQAKNFLSIATDYQTNLLSRTGDCYFQCAQNFSGFNDMILQFDDKSDIELQIENELEKDFNQLENELLIVSRPTSNVEQLILKSIFCYEMALKYCDERSKVHCELLGRIGTVKNELGVKYMYWSQENYQATSTSDSNEQKSESLYIELAKKSFDCLTQGISLFEEIKDNTNLSILLCNMGRFMRFRAHLTNEMDEFSFKKICYESGFTSYERALAVLELRKNNPELWDLVHWELSCAKYSLGKLMTEHFKENKDDAIEQEIIDLFHGSLKLCGAQKITTRKLAIHSGLVYQCLGKIFHQAYIKSSGDRKKKLSKLYFEKGSKLFADFEGPLELLGIQNDRLKQHIDSFEGCKNFAKKYKSIKVALSFACESIEPIFSKLDNYQQADVEQLQILETTLQTILKHWIHTSIKLQCVEKALKIKKLFSLTLKRDVNRIDFIEFSQHMKNVLNAIKMQL